MTQRNRPALLLAVGGVLAMAGLACLPTNGEATADSWGSIEGQFLFAGAIPELPPLARREDYADKDGKHWEEDSIPDESLLVETESRGVANIFIYLRTAPERIHPDLIEPAEKEIEFTARGCRFVPHVLAARTDQIVRWKHDGKPVHNLRVVSFHREPVGIIIQPNQEDGIPYDFPRSETIPILVACNIHPWMRAYWLVTDNPYFAITNAEGKFRINNLPEGEHTFTVWHERSGYVETPRFERKLTVNVVPGKTVTMEPFEVPAAEFDR